jgi:hypothetical protein
MVRVCAGLGPLTAYGVYGTAMLALVAHVSFDSKTFFCHECNDGICTVLAGRRESHAEAVSSLSTSELWPTTYHHVRLLLLSSS